MTLVVTVVEVVVEVVVLDVEVLEVVVVLVCTDDCETVMSTKTVVVTVVVDWAPTMTVEVEITFIVEGAGVSYLGVS